MQEERKQDQSEEHVRPDSAPHHPEGKREKADMLAAVLIHLLTNGGAHPMTVEQLASEADRNSEFVQDRIEVASALALLGEYELATEDADSVWRPTRAALESARLSF